MNRLRTFWLGLLATLWFVPTVVVASFLVLALLLIETHSWVEMDLAQGWPRLFGAGSDGARSMLSAIATSMMTVAGVVFSVTIVALAQASSQYSPRVLRNFMSDRPTQLVLGVFVGIFTYCLLVLRTVRGSEDGDPGFLPSLAVLGGLVLALFGVATLIYFIHHVASSIQVSSILQRIAGDANVAIDRLFPEPVGEPVPEDWAKQRTDSHQQVVPSRLTGYIVSVDDAGLLALAGRLDRVVTLQHRVGEFVIAGRPIAEVSGDTPLDDEDADALRNLFLLQSQRTVHQDATYGIQQIVDIAVKALSPGINDPTTAVMCIDQLGELLVRLAGRQVPGPCRGEGQTLRVIAPRADFEDMTALAFDAIADHARGDVEVFARLLHVLEILDTVTEDLARRRSLQGRLAPMMETISRTVESPVRREILLARARMLELRLQLLDV